MNKKMISIIIGIVTILSIIVISVWGKAPESPNAKIPVDILTFRYPANDDGEKELSFSLSSESRTITLEYQILPNNASNKKVTFTSNDERVVVNEDGVVSFTSNYAGSVLITVRSTDGSNKKDIVRISVIPSTDVPIIVDFD